MFTPYQESYNNVQVYSPLRPLRPPGRFANAGTASRILNQDQPQQPSYETQTTPRLRIPGVRGSLPGLQYQAPQQGEPLPTPGPVGGSYLDRLQMQLGSPEPQPINSGGFLGTVVNSLPGRAIFGALNVLDYPRRAVISTVQEAADAFNGGDASFSDWAHQVNDPAFGFGDVVGSTGNIWADRLIGFTGDVLLDPLTYVVGSSAITGTGRAARVGGAMRAVEHGVAPEIAGRLGKFGYSAINRTERQLLREAANDTILDPGWYWKLPFAPESWRQRIPGTGGLDRAVGGMFGRTRARIAGTPIGTAFRNMNTPERLEAAMTRVVTGQGDMPLEYATEFIRFRNAADRAGPVATARLNALSQELFGVHGHEGMNQAMRQAQRDGTGPFAEWTHEAATIIEEFGGRLPRGERARYAPLIPTEDGGAWLRGKSDPFAVGFKNEFYKDIDLDEVPPHLMGREMFVPGTTRTINGKVFDVGDGSIDHLNAEFARLVPDADFKLFDDDASSVMARYAKSIEESIGTIAGLKALQNSKAGLVRSADDDSVMRVVEDFAKTKLLNEAEIEKLKMHSRAAADSLKELREQTFKGISGIQGVMGQVLRGTIDTLQEVEPRTRERLQVLLQEEQALTRQRGGRSMLGGYGKTSFDGAPGVPMKGSLEREFDRIYTGLQRKLERAHARLAKVRERAAQEMPEWQRIKAQAMERGEIARIPRHLAALREWQATYELAARLAMDRESIAVMRARVIANDTRQAIVNARIGDESFLFAAANRGADEYAPIRDVREQRYTMPGNPDPDTGTMTPDTLWRLRSEDDRRALLNEETAVNRMHADYEMQRLDVLGASLGPYGSTNPEVLELSSRIAEQHRVVTEHEMIVNATAQRDGPQIQVALDEFQTQRQVESSYEAMIWQAQGRPQDVDRGLRAEADLAAHRSPTGALSLARDAYKDAQAALEQAKKRLSLENKVLQSLREQQIAASLGDTGDALVDLAQTYGPPSPIEARLPLTPRQERSAKQTLDRAIAERDAWLETDEGTRYTTQQARLDEVNSQLSTQRPGSVANQLDQLTTGSTALFSVDQRGNLRPRDTGAARHETVIRLVAERDRLEAELDALTDPTTKAAKNLQRRIRDRNRKLAQLEFNEAQHRSYTISRDRFASVVRTREDELAVARTLDDPTAVANAERALGRARKALDDNEGTGELAIRYSRSKTRTSELLDEKHRLEAERKRLVPQVERGKAKLTRYEGRIEAARRPLNAQNKVRLTHADEQAQYEQLQIGHAYKSQQQRTVAAKQVWDDAQARWQAISDEGGPSSAARLTAAQRDVKRAYNNYKQAKAELDAIAPTLKRPLSTPPAITREAQVRAALHSLEVQERDAVARIRTTLQESFERPTGRKVEGQLWGRRVEGEVAGRRSYPLNWELVPKLEPYGDRFPFAINERMVMQRAYSKISALRAGITQEGHDLTMESARRLIREIEDLLYPISPRRAAEAAGDLAEIERGLALIDASRMPYPFPDRNSKLGKILLGDPTSAELRGGAMDLVNRAKAAADSATMVLDYEDVLVNSGALIPGDFRHVRKLRDQLFHVTQDGKESGLLVQYAKDAHPANVCPHRPDNRRPGALGRLRLDVQAGDRHQHPSG